MSLQKQKRERFTLWEFWPEQVHSAGETLARRLTVQRHRTGEPSLQISTSHENLASGKHAEPEGLHMGLKYIWNRLRTLA